MKQPALWLNFQILVGLRYRAEPVQDNDDEEGFEPKFEANVFAEDGLTVSVTVRCGEEGKSPYFIEAEMLGSFSIRGDLDRLAGGHGRRALYTNLAVNGAQIVYGALRAHVATLTSIGPHRSRLMPAIIVEPADINMSASSEVSTKLAELEAETSRRTLDNVSELHPAKVAGKKTSSRKSPTKK